MPTRAAFFDLVGTLVRVRGSVGRQYAAMAARFGLEADADAVDRVFPTALAGAFLPCGPDRPPQETAAAEREAWRGIVRRVFEQAGASRGQASGSGSRTGTGTREDPAPGPRPLAPSRFDACFEALFEYFATASPWELYPDALRALDRAREAGLKLGLVTNFDTRVFRLLQHLHLSDRFDVVAIPAVAGASKPEAAIFHYAVARLRLEPAEALHVGDSELEDAHAASAAGLRGVWLNRLSPPSVPETLPAPRRGLASTGAQTGRTEGRSGTAHDAGVITSLDDLIW